MANLAKTLFPFLNRANSATAAVGLRYWIVLKYTGLVLQVLGAAYLLTAAVSLILSEPPLNYIFFIIYSAVCLVSGRLLFKSVREREANIPEAAAVASVSFLTASVVGAVPFLVLGGMTPVDSWFESMSGFTTTGFTLFDIKGHPRSLLFLRALSQWVGGMGFVVITVSIMLVSGRSAVTLLKSNFEEKLFPRIARHTQVIVATYIVATIIGVIMLLITGLKPFDAVCYTLAGISTGGFAVHDSSVGGLGFGPGNISFIAIMLIGSVNFVLYYRCFRDARGEPGATLKGVLSDPQLLLLLLLVVANGVVLGYVMGDGGGLLDGIFMAASAQTTTGYSVTDVSALPDAALMLLIGAMFVGGSIGSTAGGIKLVRLIELLKSFSRYMLIQHYARERVFPGGVSGRTLASEELPGIFYVIAVYALFVFLASTVFVLFGHDPLRSVFEVTSALGTVGLSAGIVTTGLGDGLKVFMILLMWAGRLEFLPLIIWMYSLAVRTG